VPDAGREANFTLTYELARSDLADIAAVNRSRKRRRTRALRGFVLSLLPALAFTAITVALSVPSVVKDSTGAPGWMYGLDVLLWVAAVILGRSVWLLSPGVLLAGSGAGPVRCRPSGTPGRRSA
jgi:hypothetical protein